MEKIALKPDKKLKTKLHLIILSISSLLIIVGIVLQLTVTMGRITMAEAAIIIWPIIFGLIIIKWLITTPIFYFWVKNLEYFIEEERITIHKGFITKIQQNIPYRAVTDFMLHRSLFDRILNIGSIRIQTAGQSVTPTGFEANLSGILNWNELLEELRIRLKRIHDDTSGVNCTDEDDSKVIMNKILAELTKIREVLEKK
ncbi:PH domain-containing protein [Bacteroidota bacterium]